jgi:hypothetical protein
MHTHIKLSKTITMSASPKFRFLFYAIALHKWEKENIKTSPLCRFEPLTLVLGAI